MKQGMGELFDKHGGFRRLHSFTLATIVQLETLRFCRRFLTQDPRQAGRLNHLVVTVQRRGAGHKIERCRTGLRCCGPTLAHRSSSAVADLDLQKGSQPGPTIMQRN
jgi:hypothetical protein